MAKEPLSAQTLSEQKDVAKTRRPRALWRWLLLLIVMLVLLAFGVVAGYLILGDRHGARTPAAVAPAGGQAALPAAAPQADASTGPAPKTEAIADWLLVCPADAPNSAKCLIQQQLRTKTANQTVLVWTLRKDDKGVVHSVWQAPTGVVLGQGLLIDVGDGKPRRVPFNTCGPNSCIVQAVLTPDYLQTLEAATGVSATIVLVGSDKPLQLQLSSRGLADGLARLATPQPPQQ